MFARWSFFRVASPKPGSKGVHHARRCAPRVVALEDRALLSTAGGVLAPQSAHVQAVHNGGTSASERHALATSRTFVNFPGGFVLSNPFGSMVGFPGGSVHSRPRHTHVNFPGGFVLSNPFGTVVKFPGGSVVVP